MAPWRSSILIMIDVTDLSRGPGLDARQLARLGVLERSTRLTGFQAGEAQFYAMYGTPEQRERALRVAPGGGADEG
jgi:hypothetical protein